MNGFLRCRHRHAQQKQYYLRSSDRCAARNCQQTTAASPPPSHLSSRSCCHDDYLALYQHHRKRPPLLLVVLSDVVVVAAACVSQPLHGSSLRSPSRDRCPCFFAGCGLAPALASGRCRQLHGFSKQAGCLGAALPHLFQRCKAGKEGRKRNNRYSSSDSNR